MSKLYYFQSPRFDINPDEAIAPKLGSMFRNLDRLTDPLNKFNESFIPESLQNRSTNDDFKEKTQSGIVTSLGLNVNALQGLAGTVDAVYTIARDKQNIYSCEKLETIEFEPDDEYIHSAISASQRVQECLDRAMPGRKRVFMVTGLKIATGFRSSTSKETTHGPSLAVGLDGAALGVPAEAGPEIALESSKARVVSHGRTQNRIVFAYRVVKIKKKWDGEADWKHKSGGKYSLDDKQGEQWEMEYLKEEDIWKEFPDLIPVKVVET
ncbi:hypothetical protein FB567DRAFT_537240 [Paraphoma chrysanthemicola]|uniref:Uncharacterized protein n=1 Tax=Paraphoma chrysanthemicola TaxID=798071 RepID=A0A8K0QWZ3_9PLEO|nr:hypothetical protein FB567DRAFT_537240 [Paraphoma chrysanthemicola]